MPDSINLYYFRDKSGKRHSVWKSDFDADPQGFAKAYPDARMEVINRKTGDRGHVAVGDVAAAGKEGFNLFTCRGYQKEHYNKSKVQQIAQKVGADYLSRPKNQMGKAPSAAPKNASPFVKSLYETDNAMKGADYPIDYTSTKAVQQVNQRNQQVKTEASRTAAKQNEWTRQNKPMVNNGTVGVMKTQGQFEKDIDDSAKALVGSNFDVDIDNAIDAAFENAHKVGIENIQSEMYPRGTAGMDSWISQRKYNQANDPEKILGDLTNNLKAGIDNMLSNPQTKRRILSEASRLEIDPESYIRNSVAPSIIERASERFDKSMLKRMLPNGSLEYIVGGICDSMVGTILGDLTTTRGQKEYRQRALQATRDGQNPNFKPTVWDEAGRGAVSFLTDAPAFGVAGKGAAFATNKVFGNAAQQAITAANQSAFARFGTGIAKGILHGGVTGFQYGAMNGAVQNFSTGEDTSFGATFKAALLGGASEAASFAAMEGMGGAVGALGHKIGFNGGEKGFWQGAKAAGKKISFEAVKTGFEGLGMATGGVVSGKVRSALTGEDSEGFTVEGTLESCASAAIFKLMHAKDVFGKEYGRNGKKLGFKDSVIQKTARFFASDALKSSSNVFSTEETAQLMNAGKSVGMEPLKNIIDLAKRSKKVNPNDAERGEDGSDVLNYYQQIMQDPTVSWDAKAKFTTLVMGTMPESRPMMGYLTMSKEKIGGNEAGYRRYVNEYSDKGELLSKQEYDSIEKRGRIFYLRKMVRENQRFLNSLGVLNTIDKGDYNLQNEFFKSKAKNMEEVQDILDGMNTQGSKIDYEYSIFVLERGNVMKMIESVASRYGMSKDALIKAAFDKNTLHRTDNEQQAIVQLRKECERIAFPKNKAHAEQSQIEGKDVAEENGLGSDTPNQEAVTNELRNLSSAEDALQEMMDSNDIFKETYEGLKKQGLTNPQIYDAMIQQNGLTEEQLEPFAKYINANARVQGMQQATQEAIEQHVESVADDWAFHGTMDGKKADGVQMLYVKDNNGRTLIVGSGDVAYDPTTGRPKEDVGDMLVCLDVQTRQPVYVKVEDTTLDQMQDVESFKNEERQRLQNINAAPYNQAAQEQAMKDAAKPQPKEEKTQQQEDAANNNQSEQPEDSASAEGGTQQEQAPSTEQEKPSRKFSDGTDVPMVKDSKGRPTPDYANMKPEQAAEILSADFGDNAEKVVDGQIKKAEKAVKDAEKIKVNYEGEPNDILEQENLKKQTVDAANKQLEHAKAIKKAMTAKKVAETVSKEEKHTEGANQAGSVAAQKFQDAPRLVGNKRSRTLPNNEKINGHYEIVPAESLTPSHDATNGYKKSDGFPVDAEGRTTNDRDYENDKAAQQSTDQIALKYNGQAIEQVPVVSDEGIVYDGNGRTMAGQKAAKEGTDGEYISELLDNAENFGFTREQIEKSGIEHPRLVLVTDERMPYTTETFAKFNRNEKKAQNNTEQAVAKSKTLSPEDVGAIVAEIEGNGSLEAFFNNPNAISSLWKTLQEKGIIGQNEVAGLQDMPGVPNAQGKEFIKNLVLGAMFKPETIRMMGIDGTIKNKVINGIRAIMDNSKLGDYALSDEIEGAIRLLYEARRNKMKVDDLLSQSNFADGNARDRFSEISQALAQTLEGKVSIFRDLISEYNKDAIGNGLKHKDAKEQSFGGEFGEVLDKDALIKEFLETAKIIKQNNIKLYGEETRRESSDVPSGNEEHSEETGRGTGEEKPAESAESQQRVTEPEEKSEPITITTEHGGEKYFPGGIVDLAKKIISENPEKPITHLQRGLRIDYEAATALAKELGWQDPNEKIKILPKEDGSPSNPSNPLQSLAKAADDFKREHPMTEKEIMEVDGLDDEAKYTAIDYLNGEDDSEIARICYEQAYNKRSAKRTASGGKNTAPTSPMDALKKAAAEYSEPKVETAKPKTIAEKKAAAKKLKEENDKKTQDLMNQFLAAKDEKKNGSGKALSTLIPIPSKALKWMDRNLTLTDKQKELLPQLLSAIKGSMYARIKEGIYNLEDVIENVRKDFKTFFDSLDKDDANKILAEAAYKGRFTDPETGERIKLSDAVERERKLSPEHQDKLVGDSKTAEERKQKENSFISNLKMVMGSRKVDGIRELRQLAKELGLEGVKDTDLQELAETAVVSRARDIAASKAMSPERKFAEIRKLYENQPSLNQRDSDRVEKQQYSTPAPYAYLADMYVKGNGKEIKSALEPSAGNGMLTIGLPMDKVHVNDIDEARLLNLHRQGFKNITSQDGTQPFADKDVDVVVTNPPFGTATPKEYDGYKISSLEGQMAINALDSMKDDGRAAIIIGGKTEYAKNGSLNPKDKAFLGYLYSHYNVEDVINVDGSLYAKQGTTYPTRIILINGRRAYDPENKVYPPVQKEARAEAVKDYDELYKRINDDILRSRQQPAGVLNEQGGEGERVRTDSDVHESNEKVLRGAEQGGREGDTTSGGGDIRGNEQPSETSVPELGSGENTNGEGTSQTSGGTSVRDGRGNVSPRQNDGRKNDTSGAKPMGEGNRGGRPNSSGVSGRGDNTVGVSEQSPARGVGLKETPKRELNTEKVKYVSQSSNPFSLNSVVPADQAKVTKKALDKIGDVDEFLVSELGYNDKEDMYHALGSEQADSVALAIHQAKQGNAFIIGDMTGIGKGRQAAAMIRYAYKSGKIPVFITAKKDLFSDMYRDLKSIGNAELRPFIWAAKDKDNSADMLDSEGNLVYKRTSDAEQKRVMAFLQKYGKLPEGYDYIVTTYDSFNGGTMDYENGKKTARKDGKGSKNGQAKRDLLEVIAKNANVIMDESHKAGGNGGGSSYLQYIVPKLNAITFLSATYAKRPENMPIYALRTSMNQAGVEPAELIDAIKRGGTTLQEIMSQSLAASGQFIRRERDMTGVTIDWKAIEDPVVVQEQREQYDKIIGLFNDIIDFQRTYVNSYIDQRNEDISKTQGSIKNKQGTADLGIKNTPFASRTYNMVQQVLLSLKAREAAKSAIEHLKNGEKVVIALNNTNESQTGEYAEGVEMEAPDLGVVLKKGLNGVLRYEQSDDMDNKTYGYFDVDELGPEAAARYREIEDSINNASTGLSLSPIDVIRDELEDAGYKVGELTGRTYQLARNPNGTVSKVKRTNTDKKKLALDFNTDKLDVLILNRSASTGISLHDSKDFNVKEHKPRTMIVVQQQADVNEEVQMRGRIDRTGQVNRGRYEYIVSQIPSEQRLLMMFKSKLRSLDANTTSSQKSKFNDMEVNDIINKYGDKVVKEYMADHLDLYAKMADPFGWEKAFGADLSTIDTQKLIGTSDGKVGDKEAGADASKLLGRMALLKVAEQEKMLAEIGELYKNEINRLNEMSENDLEITELPLKAKTIGKEVWKEGSEPNGDNAFADNTYIEKVNMAILKKPMKGEEVKKAQEGLTGGRSWDEYKEEKKSALKEYFVKKFNDEKVRLDERAKKIAQKAADKYNKEAKKNQEKNQLTDEQIEKNTQFQYDNVYKEEKAKADTALKNIKTKYQAFDRVLDTFNTNEAYVLPTDMNNPNEMSAFGNSYGRLIDIKITDNYSPTASTISFATLDGRRKITFPIHGLVGSGDKRTDVISTICRLTKQAEAMDDKNYRVVNKSIDNWDRMISNESRKDGYIITGNLMQALIDTKAQGLGGQLVKYTTDNGEVKTGILMPDRFKPTDAATEKVISSKADDFMSGKTTDIISSDGEVRLISVSNWRGTTIELRVPKSKAKGGKYYLDEKLRSLADDNDFYTKGGSMVANLQPENVRGVLDRLSSLGVKVREERKEGTHFRTERGLQYSETDSKDVKNSRIIPEDVDKSVSSQIEKKFDDEISSIYGGELTPEERNEVERIANLYRNTPIHDEYSKDENDNKRNHGGLESAIKTWERLATDFENYYGIKRITRAKADWQGDELNRGTSTLRREGRVDGMGRRTGDIPEEDFREYQRYLTNLASAKRALEYHNERTRVLEESYGVKRDEWLSQDTIEKIFKDFNSDKNLQTLFDRIKDQVKNLDVYFGEVYGSEKGLKGFYRHSYNDIRINLDSLSAFGKTKQDLASTILHEMLHPVTSDTIAMYQEGHTDKLTSSQIEAAKDAVDLFNEIKKTFKDNGWKEPYALTNAREFITELANPEWRDALKKIKNGDSWWKRAIKSIAKMLGFKTSINKLDEAEKVLDNLLSNFGKEQFDFASAHGKELFADKQSRMDSDNTSIVADHVSKIADKVGGNVSMVTSPEEVTNPAVKERLENGENVTGWYDEKTGEVHLYMPNIHDRYTAEKTIWHEVVGHKGMRGLFGDKFNDFLRSIYYDLDKPENAALKKLVDEERKYNPLNIYDSIEEGIARLAEDGKGEVGFWNTIKNKVTDLLHEIGYRIAPNTKDVKYLLWLSKNLQKNPNSPYWKLRANAVRERLNREKPSVTDSEGMFFGDGKARDLESMPKKEYLEATDGQIHFRTTPSAATAIDRYHRALNAHGYMFTESYMDNMLPLKKLMQAIRPDNKKIEDINASENPYVLQNTMQGAMSNEAKKFEDNIMEPLSKAMAGVLDAFDGKKEDDKIRNCNLYLIKKHGLERNRVFYVRDHIDSLKKDEATKQDATNLQNDWNTLKNDLGDQLRRNAIRLDEYYSKMDEWIRDNIDKEFNPGDNDYSGFHGIYGLDNADAYDDASVIAEVMDSEANMESVKKGSVTDFWNKINTATQYSLDSDYKNGLVTKDNHDNVSAMFDWYVPLRKFDETTAEDVYGYITEKGDPSSFIGPTLMKAKGRESLSETNILAQIGAIGNSAISRGGKNAIKQAFARFVRNNGGQGLVTEMNTWVELDGYDTNNKPIWKEALPQIPEDATPDEVAKIVSDFENDMQSKKAKGEAINITNRGRIGFKFERAKDKSQHIVDVMIAGKKHSFVINGNPRAAQALNGLLENSKATGFRKVYSSISRFVAQTCTSYNPEFVARNIVRDFEFALANVSAKEDARYRHLFEKYYAGLIPINGAKSISIKDLSGSNGFGLFAKYRNGTLDLSNKVERYFKEFMENGGETGWVQIKNMKGWEKQYKSDIKTERSGARKAGKMLKDFFFGNLENINEVAENQARFAVFCASRDYGRSAVRSAYDAKQVSTNFNRHGSGDAINSFKNGELGTMKSFERGLIGFTSSYLRHCSMFFNAGIQSTNLLLENVKNAKLGTVGFMAAEPFALGALAALLNNCLIASEDEKDRKGVKDPYGELPDYIRRNNLCIYKGNGEFVTIPLAIELRAFYGLGDMAAGLTFSPNVSGQKNAALDAVGCVSQLVPVFDYLGNSSAGKAPAAEFFKAIAPSALSPLIEWGFNSDWKGSPIERRGDFYDNSPAWERAYSGTPEFLKEINKYANAQTNDVAKGNEKMLGNKFLDAITNPSGINHFFGGVGGGAATFTLRSIGLAKNAIKGEEVETKDVPFVHSFFYTPTEQSSMQRTKSKWYNYVDDMETTIENVKSLKSKSVSPLERLKNAADYLKFQNSSDAEKVRIIEQAKKQMKKWQNMKKKSDDNESIKFADQNIDLIMQKTVDELDKLN